MRVVLTTEKYTDWECVEAVNRTLAGRLNGQRGKKRRGVHVIHL